MMLRIKLLDAEYIFCGDDLAEGGAIATAEQFQRGLPSYAHLYPNGNISRYGDIIGTRDDVTVLETIPDLEPTDAAEALSNMMFSDEWPVGANLIAMRAFLEELKGRKP